MARLGDVCEIVSGTTPKSNCPEYWDGELNWITPAEIDNDTKVIFESQRKITEQAVKDSHLKSFPAGTVILSSRAPIGKVAIAGTEMYCNQGFKNLICSECIDNTYLFWFLKSRTEYLNSLGRGATFKEISKSIVEEIDIPLPPLDEQRRIAAILDKVTSLIDLRKQQLAKLDELVKARFVEMFGDPVHNSKLLLQKRLGELGLLDRGRSQHRPRNAPELFGGPYPFIQTGNVSHAGLYITSYQNTYSEAGLQQSKMWQKNTLCITIAANIAQTAILSFDACFPDSIVGFIPYGEVSLLYIHYWFTFFQRILEEQAPQVAQKNINLKTLANLSVAIPPKHTLLAFDQFVCHLEDLTLTIRQNLDTLVMLRESIIQNALGQGGVTYG